MSELDISSGQVTAAATVALVIVGILTLVLMRRGLKGRSSDNTALPVLHSGGGSPTIHATGGVPTFQQLTQGIEIDPQDHRRARGLYETGLEQFNHYVNNRDGVVATAKQEMESLAQHLEESEISHAGRIGIALAGADEDDPSELEGQYKSLGPEAQIYAQQKRREQEALKSIANDLRNDVPRTDYTSVRSRIESGNVSLDAIMSELPITWQDLRTINQTSTRPPPVEKPPKRRFVHAVFLTLEGTYLEDKRAEKDGKWVRSDRHDMLAPYLTPYRVMEDGVPTDSFMVVIPPAIGSEWLTEMWRQGGYRDEQYGLRRDGLHPEQIRARYRRRRDLRVALALLTVEVVVLGILVLMRIL